MRCHPENALEPRHCEQREIVGGIRRALCAVIHQQSLLFVFNGKSKDCWWITAQRARLIPPTISRCSPSNALLSNTEYIPGGSTCCYLKI